MSNIRWCAALIALGASFAGGRMVAGAQDKQAAQESERKVKESDVPAAALVALKKLAAGAPITEFAEEIEHGCTYYEGSWKGPDGNIDGLVTEAGDVVEIEESITEDKAPRSVRSAAEKEAGKDGKITWERKTVYLYEIHFKKDGKGRELVFSADGLRFAAPGQHVDENGDDEK